MPENEWRDDSRYVTEALRSLTSGFDGFRGEIHQFMKESARQATKVEHLESVIRDLRAENEDIRHEFAQYRVSTENRITTVEGEIKGRAAAIATGLSLIGVIASAIIGKM